MLKYTQHEQLKKLQWERLGKTSNFSIAMIHMDCLVGLGTVIPCFSFHDKDGKGKIQNYGTPIIENLSFQMFVKNDYYLSNKNP